MIFMMLNLMAKVTINNFLYPDISSYVQPFLDNSDRKFTFTFRGISKTSCTNILTVQIHFWILILIFLVIKIKFWIEMDNAKPYFKK